MKMARLRRVGIDVFVTASIVKVKKSMVYMKLGLGV